MLAWIFGNWKSWLYLGLAAAVVVALGIAYSHYMSILNEVNSLTARNAQLELSVKAQGVTIEQQESALRRWQASRLELQEALEGLNERRSAASSELRRLNELFAEHNFEQLLQERPDSIQRLVNDGTARIIRMLECATGNTGAGCADADSPATSDSPPASGAD